MRRTAWVALFACLALTGCNARTPEPEPADYLSGTVPIGVNSDLPGWSLYRNGVWSGFDIALGNWLAGELGFTPQYVPITTDERLKVLKREDSPVKLVISNFSITDVRRDEVDFAGPYLSDAQGLMTLTGSPIGTPADIEGRAVCVVLGSTGETRIFGAKINSRPENTLDRCVQRLRAREVDAVSTDQVILEGLASYASDLRVVPGMRVAASGTASACRTTGRSCAST